MTDQEVKNELEEISTIFITAASSFNILEYLRMISGGLEGHIISTNGYLRTSIFAYYRLTILELSKLFPNTPNDKNNHFSIRQFIKKLKNETTVLTEDEANGLEKEDLRIRAEKTNRTGELIIDCIRSQRDTKIAHTDRGRENLPDGLALVDLHTLLRGGEIISSLLHKKINGVDFTNATITEPKNNLQAMVEVLAETRRKHLTKIVNDIRAKGEDPKQLGADFELYLEDRRNIIFLQ